MDKVDKDWPAVIEVPLGDGVRPLRFRRILAGGEQQAFLMGQRGGDSREEPVHRVTVSGPLYLAEVTVTQAQFEVWTRTEDYQQWFRENEELIKRTSYGGSSKEHSNGFAGNPEHPAEQVTWWEARKFGEWLEEAGFLNLPGLVATLPTEEQWEYSCRAGTETKYSFGDGEAGLDEVAWYSANSESSAHKVGEKEANDFKLFDMHGNVWEWCLDLFDERAYRLQISSESEGGGRTIEGEEDRVLRGGSWGSTAWLCRSAYRYWFGPGDRLWFHGFRLALVPGPGEPEAGDPRQGAEPKAAAVEARDEPEQAQAVGGAYAWDELKGPERPVEE